MRCLDFLRCRLDDDCLQLVEAHVPLLLLVHVLSDGLMEARVDRGILFLRFFVRARDEHNHPATGNLMATDVQRNNQTSHRIKPKMIHEHVNASPCFRCGCPNCIDVSSHQVPFSPDTPDGCNDFKARNLAMLSQRLLSECCF